VVAHLLRREIHHGGKGAFGGEAFKGASAHSRGVKYRHLEWSATTSRPYRWEGRFDGVLALGGTLGTDLALDVCSALPLGAPKYIVSTVSFSPLVPPERLPADIQMILWAGGLYGLNSVCKASFSQAAGAVLGAARAMEPPKRDRPLIGMTWFGSARS
jgi:uncharacterized protein (UPF0261 family)